MLALSSSSPVTSFIASVTSPVLQSVRSFSDISSSSSSNNVGRLVVSSGERFSVILDTVGADAKVALLGALHKSTPPSQLSRVVFEDESTLAVAKLLSNVLMLRSDATL